jgi:DNA polymerase-3 subunit epsilon
MRTDVVYLDTETTEVNDHAEVIEIALIKDDGTILLDTRVQCQGDIPLEVQDMHGISKSDLVDCPTWPDVHARVMEILSTARVIKIYNSEFDMRVIKQTAARYGLSVLVDELPLTQCVMTDYANIYCHGRWQKLVNACQQQGIEVDVHSIHSAKGDAELTRKLDRSISKAGMRTALNASH